MARRRRSAADRRESLENHHRRVAEKLIEAMQEGRAVWTQAWEPGGRNLPYNFSTGNTYRGGNSVWLATVAAERGYSDVRWGTFKQAKRMGGHVRRGEKGTQILFVQTETRRMARDKNGKPILDKEGKPVYETRALEHRRVYPYTVFNAEQCEGLPARTERRSAENWNPIEAAERVLKHSGAQIRNTGDDRAYFDLANDRIVLPHRDQFPDAPSYYQTALHELGHWTGHPNRLNRETLVRGTEAGFWSTLYAREELRAEISSMITGDRLGLGHNPERHVGYVRSWVRALRDDPREIYRAARDAQEISDWTLERVRERAPEREAGGRDGERSAEHRVLEPSAPERDEDPRPVAGEQQRLFQREREPEGRFAPGR